MFNILLLLRQTGYFALRSLGKAAEESGGLSRLLPVEVADAVAVIKFSGGKTPRHFQFTSRLSSILSHFATRVGLFAWLSLIAPAYLPGIHIPEFRYKHS